MNMNTFMVYEDFIAHV